MQNINSQPKPQKLAANTPEDIAKQKSEQKQVLDGVLANHRETRAKVNKLNQGIYYNDRGN